MSMYCNNCGEEIKEGAAFCPNCGTEISNNGAQGSDSKKLSKGKLKKHKAKRENKKTQIVISAVLIGLITLNIIQYCGKNEYDTYNDIYNRRGGLPEGEMKKLNIQVKTFNSDDIEIGDYVTFGRYEQDNDSTNGVEDIEWRVLDKGTVNSNGKKCILVISKYALDCLPYSEEYEDITWENCDLREWLNNDFYNGAFSKDEKNQIVLVNNDNPDASFFCESWEGKGGNDTSDNIFLLSFEQAENLFIDYDDRECSPTVYAMWNGTYTRSNHRCYWWLRSPGYHQNDAMGVYYDGYLYDGDLKSDYVSRADIGVRPALWIYLD